MKKRFLAVFLGIFLLLSGCMGTPSDPGGSSDPSSGGSVPFDFEILDKSQPHRILVLGNSFIWTSDVDGQLLELASANGVRLEVTRHAVGYSQAAGHYQDIFVQQLYPEVFENYYDVILLQTIYQFNDYLAVGDFLTAMDRYGIEAQLLLFPAENEGGYAENAKADYPKARLANWKQLLFEVKYNLGFGNALNFDDDIQHSSPLAGFAGAVLLYYRMFAELPDATELADRMLGAYYDQIPGETEAEKRASLDAVCQKARAQVEWDDSLYAES